MSTVVITGSNGANGANTTIPGQSGTNGSAGQTVSGSATSAGQYSNSATITGGNGGSGGYGGYNSAGASGTGGNGGTGGSATASAATQIAATRDNAVSATTTATGGNGGDYGRLSNGSLSYGSVSGPGGNASAKSVAINSADSAAAVTATSAATGGTSQSTGGGLAFGTTARAATYGDGVATASVSQSEGSGSGAASVLRNAATGMTNGGTVHLTQLATGASSTGYGGSLPGGAAISVITLDDTRSAMQSATINATAVATGGSSGISATAAAPPTPAPTLAKVDITSMGAIDASATATGSAGVNSNPNDGGQGGTGGKAIAQANAASTGIGSQTVIATAKAVGGNGGYGGYNASGEVSGAPGAAFATARAVTAGNGTAQATTTQMGAIGDNGNVVQAGSGASRMNNTVSGMTNGGTLILSQNAIGGAGVHNSYYGSPDNPSFGGTGGSATSLFNFDDTKNPVQSNLVSASIRAVGGHGGGGYGQGGFGPGGNALASASMTAAHNLALSAMATSGVGSSAGYSKAGDSAIAIAAAHGAATSQVSDYASATAQTVTSFKHSYYSAPIPNQTRASATIMASGQSGIGTATAKVAPLNYGPIDSATVTIALAGNGSVADNYSAVANAQFFGKSLADDHTDQGVADITAAPNVHSLAAVIAANAHIAEHFPASSLANGAVFSVSELGGAYTTGGIGTETVTSTVSDNIFLDTAAPNDLIVGLYNGAALGTGVTDVTLTIAIDGTDVLSRNFHSGAAAQNFFTDHPIDLNTTGSGGQLVTATLAVTTNSHGSGFYGDLLLGVANGTGSGAAAVSLIDNHVPETTLPTTLLGHQELHDTAHIWM